MSVLAPTDLFELEGYAQAQAELLIAMTIGEPVQYSNRGSAAITIWATPVENTDSMSDILQTRSEEIIQFFYLPAQIATDGVSLFPSVISGLTVTDVITWHGKNYRIDNWTDKKSHGGVYYVKTIQTLTKQLGQIS